MATRKTTTSSKKTAAKPTVKKLTGTKFKSTSSAKIASSKTTSSVSSSDSTNPPLRVRKSYVAFIVVLALLAVMIVRYKGVFIAAMVNGMPIYRVNVVRETEKQAGKQTINNLVRNSLIEQEAKKQNVTITDKEIDAEIKKVETTLSKSGQKMDQVLALQGLTKEDLRKLIRLDKLVSKMVGKDIKITDKEVTEYIEKNKESLPADQTEAQLSKSVSDNLRQQKLNEKVQQWLAELQKKANVQYFVQY
ncbi:MAG TPA: SurA N-terminal domain-containing protein [Candidatus Limnocylindrales bacterium]|nr:SurA N-terminal domain-containing protein [Candidatus Limnocylindrales bacterium]